MRVDDYLSHIPDIEEKIRALRPDAIVFGMGPTAWLLPWINQSLLRDVRLWGAHDAWHILPCDDLVIFDVPVRALHPITTRYECILRSRPRRLWAYERNWPSWDKHIHAAVKPNVRQVRFGVWSPAGVMPGAKFKLDADPPHTLAISPTGCTTLAWREGARRIGVIGADMLADQTQTSSFVRIVDPFFSTIAEQAKAAGGAIWNLSPISALKRFRQWTISEFSSAQTAGSVTPEPSAFLSTASGSTPASQ